MLALGQAATWDGLPAAHRPGGQSLSCASASGAQWWEPYLPMLWGLGPWEEDGRAQSWRGSWLCQSPPGF